jgi:hypothetical protein
MSEPFGHRAQEKAVMPGMHKFARPAHVTTDKTVKEPAAGGADAVDDEIRQWKKARGSNFPVKLLALVATISLGVASIALPAKVNDWVQYPLFALSAVSLYVGFARRKAKA